MNRIIFENNKRIQKEIYRDCNLFTYRLTFFMPIKFLGFIIGHKKLWYEHHYPVFENDEMRLEKIAEYCQLMIDETRGRARKRRQNAINKMKQAYDDTLRSYKTKKQQAEKEN